MQNLFVSYSTTQLYKKRSESPIFITMSSIRKLLFPVLLLMGVQTALSTTLNVTAINAHKGKSHFECWSLSAPFFSSTQNGVVGTQASQLGQVANITYGVIPAGYDSGFHTAPAPQ
jgi:hypothetical protein